MLTIKHITDSGETIYQGSEVQSFRGIGAHVNYLDGREWKQLLTGVVYVMNDAGKTVATYDLNPLPDPLLAGQLQGGSAAFSHGAARAV